MSYADPDMNTPPLGIVRLICGHYTVADDFITLKITIEEMYTSKPIPDYYPFLRCFWCVECEEWEAEDEPYEDNVNKPEGGK